MDAVEQVKSVGRLLEVGLTPREQLWPKEQLAWDFLEALARERSVPVVFKKVAPPKLPPPAIFELDEGPDTDALVLGEPVAMKKKSR